MHAPLGKHTIRCDRTWIVWRHTESMIHTPNQTEFEKSLQPQIHISREENHLFWSQAINFQWKQEAWALVHGSKVRELSSLDPGPQMNPNHGWLGSQRQIHVLNKQCTLLIPRSKLHNPPVNNKQTLKSRGPSASKEPCRLGAIRSFIPAAQFSLTSMLV